MYYIIVFCVAFLLGGWCVYWHDRKTILEPQSYVVMEKKLDRLLRHDEYRTVSWLYLEMGLMPKDKATFDEIISTYIQANILETVQQGRETAFRVKLDVFT